MRGPSPKLPQAGALHDALELLFERALRHIPKSRERTAQLASPRPGLFLLRQHEATAFEASIYDPMLCLILQGCKEMAFAEHDFRLRAGECALVSHDLPIVSRVREAPYLVLLLKLELDVLRSLYADLTDLPQASAEAHPLEVHRADPALLDALTRYLALADSKMDARVLGPMLQREVHYRLLTSPLGYMLRRLTRHDSHESAITRAIALLRKDFRSPVVVEELARTVGMSVSSFHKHFKAVTSSSPLQYQKDLRLLEARRLLLAGSASVTTVAFDVGYESPSQFSREYARKFGNPPSREPTLAPASGAILGRGGPRRERV